MKHLQLFYSLSLLSMLFACTADDGDTIKPDLCKDGIQNRTETGVDCGGDCIECPDLGQVTDKYFFQFKRGDTAVFLENDFPYFVGTTTAFPPIGYKWGAEIIYAGDVMDLAGKYISFKEEYTPRIEIMYFDEKNKILSSAYPPSQSGSNCYIRSVELADTLITGIANPVTNYIYKVKGEFNCRISNTNNTYTDTLTYGKFALRITVQK